MYGFFLILHSILRWLVVLSAVLAVGGAWIGWLGKRPWRDLDERLGMVFTAVLDLQLLVGIVLYFFLSPLTTSAFANLGAVMSNALQRYFAIEHLGLMVVAIALAHIGRSLSRKAEAAATKYQRAAIFFLLSLLVMLAAIPWPFLPTGRPWIRF